LNNPDQKHILKVIPIGGLGQIGNNMMALEYGSDAIIIDCGISFKDNWSGKREISIPDLSYVSNNKHKIRAIFLTHGHEDHIGAIGHLASKVPVPIYGSALTNLLVKSKITEFHLDPQFILNTINEYQPIVAGCFVIQFFKVSHSIPDSMGLIIDCPIGKIVHTGDFKIDHTPADNRPADLQQLSSKCSEGILLLCSDSTYSELEGYTPSESIIKKNIDSIIRDSEKRIFVATFASLISRVQQLLDSAFTHDRKVCFMGRSMINNVKICLNSGHLYDPGQIIVTFSESQNMRDNEIMYITTGGQGEGNSAIGLLSRKRHPDLNIKKGDTVVLSSDVIPGNEIAVGKVIDDLSRQGANVIYNKLKTVHVNGHARAEELRLMMAMTKPKHFLPIHGEYRHLVAHSKIAASMGIPISNIHVIENNDVLELFDNFSSKTIRS
jgi:ribonuclease J